MNARDLKDLIQDVLKHPEFNADEVDHNMHERLMRAVEDGQMDILDMRHQQQGRLSLHPALARACRTLAVSALAGRRRRGLRGGGDWEAEGILGCPTSQSKHTKFDQ